MTIRNYCISMDSRQRENTSAEGERKPEQQKRGFAVRCRTSGALWRAWFRGPSHIGAHDDPDCMRKRLSFPRLYNVHYCSKPG